MLKWLPRVLAVFLALAATPAFAQAPQQPTPVQPAADPITPANRPDQARSLRAFADRVSDLEAYANNGPRVLGAKDTKLGGPGPSHNGWMMVCTALVLFMTLPGLALFYGGMVRRKNVLSVMAQCLGLASSVTILWWAFGYSAVFAPGSPFVGSMKFAFLSGVDGLPNADYSAWVSHNVWAMFQLMFAIITPSLMVGAIAERMKFSAIMLFCVGWVVLVYLPLAHMTWGIDGFMNGVWNAKAGIQAIDFAGGTVVHMSSGWSALVLALILGKRKGFRVENFAPHSLVLTMMGTGMLWVGWYGFNAGSAAAADAVAANAFMTTTLAAAAGATAWAGTEWLSRGKPTVLGFCSGAIGGLVVITPAAGFVSAASAMLMGVLAGGVLFLACTRLKNMFGYDDALDTFGVHAVGGTLGALLTGFFASAEVNPNLGTHLKGVVGKTLWLEQLKAMGLTIVLAVVVTVALAYAIKALIGLRPTREDEEVGLDLAEHGERAYHMSEIG